MLLGQHCTQNWAKGREGKGREGKGREGKGREKRLKKHLSVAGERARRVWTTYSPHQIDTVAHSNEEKKYCHDQICIFFLRNGKKNRSAIVKFSEFCCISSFYTFIRGRGRKKKTLNGGRRRRNGTIRNRTSVFGSYSDLVCTVQWFAMHTST